MWNLSRRVPALAESTGVPVAYWLEDLWPIDPDTHTRYWQSPGSGRLGRAVMPWVARLALRQLAAEGYPPPLHYRHVACGSQFLQRKLAAQIPAFQDAAVVLCGIELEAYADCQPRERLHDAVAPRIIYVGGLGPHKGVHTAIEAISHLTTRSPGLQPSLTVVGSGHPNYEARLRQLAEESGSVGRVRFTGTVPKESVPSLLVEHDILVVPSVWEEPFGRVVVEGMAAGLPVVGTATGGSAEILQDDVNGLVFPVEDSGALADRLLRLVGNPALYARLAHAGRETSQRFDLRFMIDGLERFLLDVAAPGTQERQPDASEEPLASWILVIHTTSQDFTITLINLSVDRCNAHAGGAAHGDRALRERSFVSWRRYPDLDDMRLKVYLHAGNPYASQAHLDEAIGVAGRSRRAAPGLYAAAAATARCYQPTPLLTGWIFYTCCDWAIPGSKHARIC